MKRILALILFALIARISPAAEGKIPALPVPLSNNAVTTFKTRGQVVLFSFMGIGPKKTWDAITNAAYIWQTDDDKWTPVHSVPGTAGRIAASAASARSHVFLFGGYVVDGQGRGQVVPDVNVYEPLSDRWFRGADIPTPVGDAVIGVYRDRYIYLIGGRNGNRPISEVQIYDAEKNVWFYGTRMTGPSVFGHAGAVLDDTIVYVNGAQQNASAKSPAYVASEECWVGKIDRHDFTKISWSKLPNHPGSASFRIAAGGSERDHKIYFTGGTDNPYDENGIGYDGKPSEPSPTTFAFNLRSGQWETISDRTPDPTMDHRGLLVTAQGLVVVGGMEKSQRVTSRVTVLHDRSKAAR